MDVLDWVGKRLKRSDSKSDHNIEKRKVGDSKTDDIETHEVRTISIEELERELGQNQERDLDVSKSAKELLNLISGRQDQLRQLVGKMEGASVGKDVEYGVIGETMRKQFFARMTILLDSLKKPESDYRSLASYHGDLMRFLANADRILRDNRYLFHFFEAETKTFATTMRALEADVNELKKVLDGKVEKAEEYAFVESRLVAVKNSKFVLTGFEKRVEENLAELSGLDCENNEEIATIEKELLQAQQEESRLALLHSDLRSKVANALGPLHKLLLKYAHDSPKKERLIAEKYANDPVKALFESGDGREFKTLLASLRMFSEKRPEVGYPQSLVAFESGLSNIMDEHRILDEKAERATENVIHLRTKKAKEEARNAERARLLEESERRKTRLAEEKERQAKLIAEIGEKASVLLHRQVRIGNLGN